MPAYVTLEEAVEQIADNDYVWTNAFLAAANPVELQIALGARVKRTGAPRGLTFCCTAGFGDWDPASANEDFIRYGAVKSVILGHFTSTPTTAKMIMQEEIEGYNLPQGVMSKMVRAAAGGETYYISHVGLNLFVDPMYKEYQLNRISTEEYVTDIMIDGRRKLKYRIPDMNVALIKASSADSFGNVSFEKEGTVTDALSLAQAVRCRKGKVIVQVECVSEKYQRPWDAIIPAALIDYLVVCPEQKQLAASSGYSPAYAGDVFYDNHQMRELVMQSAQNDVAARNVIAKRAVRELKPGHIANIGVGIPERIAAEAAQTNLLDEVCLTIESGAMKCAPAPGKAFGAAIGAHSIFPMAQMFDLYDGGGLDICFLGALEIDAQGNVNSHSSEGKLSGIGGFANISQNTPRVVFCATFFSGGLEVEERGGQVKILREGRHKKFVNKVTTVSFSAANALDANQQVLYITERCVFRLCETGLELIEVMPGIDIERDILAHIPFAVTVAPGL